MLSFISSKHRMPSSAKFLLENNQCRVTDKFDNDPTPGLYALSHSFVEAVDLHIATLEFSI